MTTHLLAQTSRPVAAYPAVPADFDRANMTDHASLLMTPPQSANHSLFIQLRHRYPTGSLVSELLQVHEKNFVVRVLIQVAGATLASGMAAAEQIEIAEDRARIRAMEVLGIVPTESVTLSSSGTSADLKLPAITRDQPGTIEAVDEEIVPPSPTIAPILEPTNYPLQTSVAAVSSSSSAMATEWAEELSEGVAERPTSPQPAIVESSLELSEPTAKPEAKVLLADLSLLSEPIDLSDAIAQIGTEIERIGWNKKQGSAHLQKTYSKRTRAELTEEELLEFLSYLKSLPSKGQPELSQVPF